MNTCFLLIGGNLGDRFNYLTQAARLIGLNIGRIIDFSPIYETAAWGNTGQASFLNQVLKVQTALSADNVLQKALNIEQELGRIRNEKYGARTIDIDILLYNNDLIHQPDLTVPHPRMAERKFVLTPLNAIAPTYLHPVHLKTVEQLYYECVDSLDVKKYIP